MSSLDLSTLTNDGDTLELADGRTLRLRFEPDPDSSINDYDSDGRVEWTRNNDYGAVRPDGFTGRARILEKHLGSSLWWEPYEDLTEDQIRSEEFRIHQLVEYGFNVVFLELCDGEDAFGRPVVKEYETLGMVEWDASGAYLKDILEGMLAEMEEVKTA